MRSSRKRPFKFAREIWRLRKPVAHANQKYDVDRRERNSLWKTFVHNRPTHSKSKNPKSSNPTKLETTLQTSWKKPRNPPINLEEEFAPENILIGMELASIGHLTVQICQFWINSWTNESKNTCMMMVASIHLPNLNNASILRSRKSPKRKSQTP